MIQWGKTYEEQKHAIETHLGNFFSYQRSEDQCIRDLMHRRNEAEEEYMKFRANLLKKKERLYPDPTKWEAPQSMLNKIPNLDKLSRDEAYNYMLPR
jgi:hypothetical protein